MPTLHYYSLSSGQEAVVVGAQKRLQWLGEQLAGLPGVGVRDSDGRMVAYVADTESMIDGLRMREYPSRVLKAINNARPRAVPLGAGRVAFLDETVQDIVSHHALISPDERAYWSRIPVLLITDPAVNCEAFEFGGITINSGYLEHASTLCVIHDAVMNNGNISDPDQLDFHSYCMELLIALRDGDPRLLLVQPEDLLRPVRNHIQQALQGVVSDYDKYIQVSRRLMVRLALGHEIGHLFMRHFHTPLATHSKQLSSIPHNTAPTFVREYEADLFAAGDLRGLELRSPGDLTYIAYDTVASFCLLDYAVRPDVLRFGSYPPPLQRLLMLMENLLGEGWESRASHRTKVDKVSQFAAVQEVFSKAREAAGPTRRL